MVVSRFLPTLLNRSKKYLVTCGASVRGRTKVSDDGKRGDLFGIMVAMVRDARGTILTAGVIMKKTRGSTQAEGEAVALGVTIVDKLAGTRSDEFVLKTDSSKIKECVKSLKIPNAESMVPITLALSNMFGTRRGSLNKTSRESVRAAHKLANIATQLWKTKWQGVANSYADDEVIESVWFDSEDKLKQWAPEISRILEVDRRSVAKKLKR